ncbi:MAG: NAD(P)-binding domain-containing protein [Deltaproteobacteria bacterium]|nr:NAD(P)-binding domain-containing protein [Deltaproteobacteria bacterium]
MATALMKGIVESGLYDRENVMACNTNGEQLQKILHGFGMRTLSDSNELVRKSRIVLT